ncbi:MAG TPA: hypothetical protein VH475_26310 [Tepidisphaeraceae bacterium]|jgi:hypothetical protein
MTPPSRSAKGQAVPTQGFEIIERLIAEYRKNRRAPTLERWMNQCGQRLTQYCAENSGATAQREAATVGRALELAGELVAEIASMPSRPARR